MLDLLRRKAQSPYLQATVLIIIVVFIFWGVGNNSGGARNAVATVNGEAVTLMEFDRAFTSAIDRYRSQFGGNLPKDFVETFGVKQLVLNELVQNKLLLQGGKQMGLWISDEEIQETIQQMGAFQNNGNFDVDRYREVLKASRLTPTKFEDDMRSDLLATKTSAELSGFGRVLPMEVTERYLYGNQELRLAYGQFKPEEFVGQVKPLPEAIQAYFDANKESYRSAAQIQLSYLLFSRQEALGKVTASEEELQEYYNSHADEFSQPEKRRASHILLQTTDENKEVKRKLAEDLLAQLRGGQDFAELARRFSEDSSAAQGGDLGFFARGSMVKPFEDAVFALKKDELSELVTTTFGYHIIKLTGIQPAVTTTFAEAKAGIEQKLKEQKAANAVFEQANEAYEKIIFAGSMAKYADNFGITPKQTEFFAKDNPPDILTAQPALLETAFSLRKGELSSLLESKDGYMIALLADRREPEVPALEAVRAQVEKDFIVSESHVLCRKAAQESLDAVRGKDAVFAQVLQEKGVSVQESPFFSRGNRSAAKLPMELVDAAFRLTASAPLPSEFFEADDGSCYVYRFKEQKDAPPESESARKEVESSLAAEKNRAIIEAWTTLLMKRGKVTVNEQYLK